MDNSPEHPSVAWRFALAAGAVAMIAATAPGASAWWEYATLCVLGALAVVLTVTGLRGLLARRRAADAPDRVSNP